MEFYPKNTIILKQNAPLTVFLAPYLRKFGQLTTPDFLGARYGGNLARTIGIAAAIITSLC